MKNITQLLEITLTNLKDKNVVVTPNNFEREFYSLLNETDIVLEDYEDFQFLADSLSDEEKEEFLQTNKTTLNLAKILINRVSSAEIKLFLKHFIYFISSSISNYKTDELQEIVYNIAKNPHTLVKDYTIRNLRKYADNRKKADKDILNEKTSDIKKLIYFFEDHIKTIILEHDSTKEEVLQIKNDLEELDISNSSKEELKHFQGEMLKLVEKIEDTINNSSAQLSSNQIKCVDLYEQIEVLQCSLNKAEEEKAIDFLTGVLTRRAYVRELERIENEYNVFDSKYAIVFYDIDHFKQINDNYGHDCGDIILNKFATILNKLTRTGDIISRYGGEEFVSLIHYNEENEVQNYLTRVKNIINNNKFISKENKIDVRFSAGVAFRNKYDSYDKAIVKADGLLYKAKKDGRNRIILDTDEIL